jgi:hypothetical protein
MMRCNSDVMCSFIYLFIYLFLHPSVTHGTLDTSITNLKKNGKTVPLQAWGDPEGSKKLGSQIC